MFINMNDPSGILPLREGAAHDGCALYVELMTTKSAVSADRRLKLHFDCIKTILIGSHTQLPKYVAFF